LTDLEQIPAERRTMPMGLDEAARHLFSSKTAKRPGRRLVNYIDRNKYRCYELTRESFIFDLASFPPACHPEIRPS
jgi:hypothetical protein